MEKEVAAHEIRAGGGGGRPLRDAAPVLDTPLSVPAFELVDVAADHLVEHRDTIGLAGRRSIEIGLYARVIAGDTDARLPEHVIAGGPVIDQALDACVGKVWPGH